MARNLKSFSRPKGGTLKKSYEMIIAKRRKGALEIQFNRPDRLNAVNEQMERVAATRQQRELCRQQLVTSLGGTDETTFREMTAMLPAEVQPLLDALVQEINQLLQNIQKWLRQNHMLLQRSLDLMQTIMKSMFPSSSAVAGTYGRSGQVSPVNPPPSSLYEGII